MIGLAGWQEKKCRGSILVIVVPWVGSVTTSISWIELPRDGRILVRIREGMRNSFLPARLTRGGTSLHFFPKGNPLGLDKYCVGGHVFGTSEVLTVQQ